MHRWSTRVTPLTPAQSCCEVLIVAVVPPSYTLLLAVIPVTVKIVSLPA